MVELFPQSDEATRRREQQRAAERQRVLQPRAPDAQSPPPPLSQPGGMPPSTPSGARSLTPDPNWVQERSTPMMISADGSRTNFNSTGVRVINAGTPAAPTPTPQQLTVGVSEPARVGGGMPAAVSPRAAEIAAGIVGTSPMAEILRRGALRGEYAGGEPNFNDNITNKPLGGGFQQIIPGPPKPGTMSEDYVRYMGYSFDNNGVLTGMRGYNPPPGGFNLAPPPSPPSAPRVDPIMSSRADMAPRDWSSYFGGMP